MHRGCMHSSEAQRRHHELGGHPSPSGASKPVPRLMSPLVSWLAAEASPSQPVPSPWLEPPSTSAIDRVLLLRQVADGPLHVRSSHLGVFSSLAMPSLEMRLLNDCTTPPPGGDRCDIPAYLGEVDLAAKPSAANHSLGSGGRNSSARFSWLSTLAWHLLTAVVDPPGQLAVCP